MVTGQRDRYSAVVQSRGNVLADNSVSAEMAGQDITSKKHHWSIWLSRFALFLGILTVGIALIGAVGAGERWWSQGAGLQALTVAFGLAVMVIIFSLLVLFYYRKEGARIFLAGTAALLLAGGYVGYIATQLPKASANPLHDVSTDLANPPAFTALTLRDDDLAEIPGKDDKEYRGMDAFERWQAIHEKLYPDIQTLHVFQPVGLTIQRAEKIARGNGWEIALADPVNGRLEATDEVALQKFQDDIILRAIPDGDGEGSLVDIRSVSRYGQSDLGVNARRIRSFSAQLLEQLGGEILSDKARPDEGDEQDTGS